MFYCEINENKICFHVTENELPESEIIIKSEENQLGRMWIDSEWIDIPIKNPIEEVIENNLTNE